jgi:hypothetical protein
MIRAVVGLSETLGRVIAKDGIIDVNGNRQVIELAREAAYGLGHFLDSLLKLDPSPIQISDTAAGSSSALSPSSSASR